MVERVRGVFPVTSSFVGQQSSSFPLVHFGGKRLPFDTVALFSCRKRKGIFKEYFVELIFPEIYIACRLSEIGFLPLACRTAYYLSHFSNFTCLCVYIVQGQKELKRDGESSYRSLVSTVFCTLFFLERSSPCLILSCRFAEWVVITPDLSRAQQSD